MTCDSHSEHNQQQTRHDIWAQIWALKFEPIIFFHHHHHLRLLTGRGVRFRFTIRHEVSKTSPPVIWRPPTCVATAVVVWIVAISLLRLGVGKAVKGVSRLGWVFAMLSVYLLLLGCEKMIQFHISCSIRVKPLVKVISHWRICCMTWPFEGSYKHVIGVEVKTMLY